jgi:hypothetical protein
MQHPSSGLKAVKRFNIDATMNARVMDQARPAIRRTPPAKHVKARKVAQRGTIDAAHERSSPPDRRERGRKANQMSA